MKKITFLKTIFVAAFIFAAGMVSATSYFVASTGNDTNDGLSAATPFLTLTYTLSKAVTGDVINVSDFINVSGENAGAGVVINKNVTINGVGTSIATCGLDGNNTARVAQISNNTVVFHNLTIKNGGPTLTVGDGAGVKISGSATSQVSFLDCIFENNKTDASKMGGAIYYGGDNVTYKPLIVKRSEFKNNFSNKGGAIFVLGSIDIDGANFHNQDISTTSGALGGAIFFEKSYNVSIKNSTFKDNKSKSGGAIQHYNSSSDASNFLISSCAFVSNTATASSSALFFRAISHLTIVNSTFAKNKVAASSDGGAINLYSSLNGVTSPSVNITNCTITENTTAGSAGHGAGIRILSNQFVGVLNINNSIIEGNIATQTATTFSDLSTGAIVPTAATLMIHNSIIGRNGNVAVPVECYPGNNHFNYLTSTSTSADLIAGLGAFNTAYNCYPLLSTSPSVNYGTSSYLSSLSPAITTDQLGSTRPYTNMMCEIGAIEVLKVNITSPSSSPTSSSLIPVSITFNKPVANFTIADLILGNSTASNFAGSGATYTVDITAIAKGNVTVDIASDVVTDVLEIGNTVATQFVINYDNTTGIVNARDCFSAYSTDNAIVIIGNVGQSASIYSVTGQAIKSILLTSNKITVPATQGFYIVKIGDRKTKVLVK